MGFTSFATTWTGGDGSAMEDEVYIAGQLNGRQILAPIIEAEDQVIRDQLKVAATLARSNDASLRVINLVTLRDSTPHDQRHELGANDENDLVRWALDTIDTETGTARGRRQSSRALVKRSLRAITSHDIDTVVLPGGSSRGILRRDTSEQIAAHAQCNVVIANGQPGYDDVVSILLPIAGGPHSGLATDIAKGIAEDHDAWIDLLHVVDQDSPESKRQTGEQYLTATGDRLEGYENYDTWLLEADDVAKAIIEQSEYYPLTVLGAPTKGRLRQYIFGSTTNHIRKDAQSAVLVGQNNRVLGCLTQV